MVSGQRLRHLAVQPQTAARYRSAYLVFKRFVSVFFNMSVSEAASRLLLDECFEFFVDKCYQHFGGSRRQLCVNALQGVLLEHGHQLRNSFPCSRRALTAWTRTVPTRSALPLPQHWVDVFAAVAVLRGYGVLGLGLVVCFDGYLRVSELCNLHGSDILVESRSTSGSTGCGLRIRKAKTGKNQFARITDPLVIDVLRLLKSITPADQLVFKGATPRFFNKLLTLLCHTLDIKHRFTMHSLRHGRASKAHLDREPPEHIRLDGRWASSTSMEGYLQAAVSLLQTLTCSDDLQSLFRMGPACRAALVPLYHRTPRRY